MRSKLIISTLFVSGFALAQFASALPFNDDMVDIQPKTGSFMRPKVASSIPMGTLKDRLEKKEDGYNLVNPKKGDPASTTNGKRLFQVNCSPCHGNIEKTTFELGPVGNKLMMMKPPDITVPGYRDTAAGKSDGYIYATIHFGGLAFMPGLGWKLSPDEHWDIVNYVRSVQNAKGKQGG